MDNNPKRTLIFLGANMTIETLVAECLADIASGQTGFFYVRECFDGINAGWNPVPIVLPGIVWSQLSAV